MTPKTFSEQITVPCVYMRGGTSKALFFHEQYLPDSDLERDRLLLKAMGSPDPLQVDGMGGGRLVTSKVAIIRRSSRPDADVDYLFAQVDIERGLVGYTGNCGNISAAVGPFAIDEGLVAAQEPVTTVRIYNRNTNALLIAHVPVRGGRAQVHGDCRIAGVPGTGAPIMLDYSATIGATTGRLLPTKKAIETLLLDDGSRIDVSVCDAGNPCVFVNSADLGLEGNEAPADISANGRVIGRACEIQARVGEMLGFWPDWRAQRKPGLPLLVTVAPPATFPDPGGGEHAAGEMDLRARLIFLGACHDSLAGTGSICLAAVSRVTGSVVNRMLDASVANQSPVLRIGHPLGVMEVSVAMDETRSDGKRITKLGLVRTARRLMAGEVYVAMVAENTGEPS